MKREIIITQEGHDALYYMQDAISVAKNATCNRSKCGAVIIKNNKILGAGFNSPPKELESQKRCDNKKKNYNNKVIDKTCCVHAEQRAIMDALRKNPSEVVGSTLYFIRLDKENNPLFAGSPYCTICSKMVLDVGIKEFVLWHEEGIVKYDAEYYNDLSFNYN